MHRKQGSDATGRNYYYNYVTGASQWDPPENWAINLADQWVRNLVSLSMYNISICIYVIHICSICMCIYIYILLLLIISAINDCYIYTYIFYI